MAEHHERPPSALAHGPVKSDDIERLRRDVDKSEAHAVRDKKTSAARREAELRDETEPPQDPAP